MAARGLEGVDETVQQTYVWVNAIADAFRSDRHQGYQILRAFLHTLRDHLTIDESAQFAAQLPLLLRGLYYEGWDPSRSLQHERSGEAFLARFSREANIRAMDARDAVAIAADVVRSHVSAGEMEDVLFSLPSQVRELVG